MASELQRGTWAPDPKVDDWVNWTIVAHAISNLPDARYARMQHGAALGRRPCACEMNTTPLIDVMLVLSIMLIITIRIRTQSLRKWFRSADGAIQ